jgi:hypothetical protein
MPVSESSIDSVIQTFLKERKVTSVQPDEADSTEVGAALLVMASVLKPGPLHIMACTRLNGLVHGGVSCRDGAHLLDDGTLNKPLCTGVFHGQPVCGVKCASAIFAH